MRRVCFQMLGGLAVVMALTGCVTTQPQADGSTKVHLSLGGVSKASQGNTAPFPATEARPAVVANQARPDLSATASAPGIRATALADVFSKHPYDGTPKTFFPRVAVTVTDWSRNDCWSGTATIWWSKSKSEAVPAFSVCWGQSVGYAVNNAANLHLFMQQTAVEHSGNVRTVGPKPPMLSIPDRQPISERQQLAFQGFVQQLLLDTGWQPGAPTNLWLVGYDANAAIKPTMPPVSSNGASQPVGAKTKAQLEQALGCTAIHAVCRRDPVHMAGVDGEVADREVGEGSCAAGFQKCVERRQRVVLASLLSLIQFIQDHDGVGLWLVGQQLEQEPRLGIAPEGF